MSNATNNKAQRLREKLVHLRERSKGYWRDYYDKLLREYDDVIYRYEREIDDAFNGALRNSEFPGDLVGRLDDDFAD